MAESAHSRQKIIEKEPVIAIDGRSTFKAEVAVWWCHDEELLRNTKTDYRVREERTHLLPRSEYWPVRALIQIRVWGGDQRGVELSEIDSVYTSIHKQNCTKMFARTRLLTNTQRRHTVDPRGKTEVCLVECWIKEQFGANVYLCPKQSQPIKRDHSK